MSVNVNNDLDELLFRWITDCNYRGIGLCGPLIQEKVRSFASDFDMTDFKASYGWIEKLRNDVTLFSSLLMVKEMDKSTLSGGELLKLVTLLQNIYWLNKVWNSVGKSTIVKSFNKCGFYKPGCNINLEGNEYDCNPDNDVPIIGLVRSYNKTIYGSDVRDIVNKEIPTCDSNEIDWDKPASELLRTESLGDCESDNDDTVKSEPIVSVCTVTEAIAMFPKLNEIAIRKVHSKLLSTVMELQMIWMI
ncbi:hypothetical protein ACF0H5_014401 [Mactra antiquata]